MTTQARVTGFRHDDGATGARFDNVLLLAGKRTPFGRYCGALSGISPTDLGIMASKGALEGAGVPASEIDQTLVANIGQAAADAFFLPRHIALYAGAPVASPALLLQRICGSGIEIIGAAAQEIALGKARVVLACGTETMSRFPLVSYGARQGFPLGKPDYTDLLWAALDDTAAVPMGVTADNLARKYELTREGVDRFALRSQERYAAAQAAGYFAGEILAVEAKGAFTRDGLKPRNWRLAPGVAALAADEHPRPTTPEKLAKLAPVFTAEGPTSAGSASGIVDGAAACVLASGSYAQTHGLTPMGRILGYASVGCEPEIMGIGPVPAIKALLKELHLRLHDIDLFEINEAFGAQCLAVAQALGVDQERLNVNGGAIAIGHPLAATGTRLTLTCLRALKARGGRLGIVSACIGGGQGIALAVEAL